MPTELTAIEPPTHPLHALTTFELRDYRRRLESAIAYSGITTPWRPADAGPRWRNCVRRFRGNAGVRCLVRGSAWR
jgi:hypothetical protein